MSTAGHSYCGVCSRDLDNEILNDGEFMILCDVCNTWYHGRCVELEEFEAADIDHYHCPSCISQAGPSRPKRVCNNHRYDYSDTDAANKPTENGTKKFIEELKKRKFRTADSVVVMNDGHSLSGTYLDQTNFQSPILVENAAGLGMILPPSNFTVEDVERRVGGDRYVDVVDVYTQHSFKMRLRTFLDFFRQQNRPKLYNLISLEFSDTELSKLMKVPDVVEELSWVEQYWPKPLREDLSTSQKAILNEHITVRPEVSKFCLIGMAESYTDFHIDFGGTSVFYHVLWGEKVFYLIEPSDKNLRLFEEWQQTIGYSEQFFGDLVTNCSRLVLKPGQTFFIPTGWIHAVYTPKDSLVIGGNFLHSFNIGLQIRIYEMEKAVSTSEKFMFPHFELTNWYAGVHFLDMLKELNEEKTPAKTYMLEGLKALVASMKTWVQRNQANMKRSKLSGQIIIETMTCAQVLKQLERAVHTNEKLAVAASTKPKAKKRVEISGKITEIPSTSSVSTSSSSSSSVVTPIRVSVPLPKLKVPSKSALERSKGCPKSPAKSQLLADEVVNAVVNSIGASQKVAGISQSKSQDGKQKKKDKEKDKEKKKEKDKTKEKAAPKPEKKSSPHPLRTSDGRSKGPDLDSAPPTPKWEDAEESVDPTDETTIRFPQQDETDAIAEVKHEEPEVPMEAEEKVQVAEEVKNGEAEKKVFGFSLLDIQMHDPLSPTSPRGKEPGSAMHSPVASLPKLDFKLSPEKCSYAQQQSTSIHGRPQKPSQRIVGKMPSNSKAEFYPDLGYCRQDEEFVYPSLSDSEPGEAVPKKKRRPEKEKSPAKKSEDVVKMKLQLSLNDKKIGDQKAKKAKHAETVPESKPSQTVTDKPSTAAAAKTKKIQKGTTKQRLANKLKIRKLIPM